MWNERVTAIRLDGYLRGMERSDSWGDQAMMQRVAGCVSED